MTACLRTRALLQRRRGHGGRRAACELVALPLCLVFPQVVLQDVDDKSLAVHERYMAMINKRIQPGNPPVVLHKKVSGGLALAQAPRSPPPFRPGCPRAPTRGHAAQRRPPSPRVDAPTADEPSSTAPALRAPGTEVSCCALALASRLQHDKYPEVMDLYERAAVSINCRLHSGVLAASALRPIVYMASLPKFIDFMTSIEQENFLVNPES